MLKQNIEKIFNNINNACSRVGRKIEEITVIAVTKTETIETAQNLIKHNIKNLGENRVQEFLRKYESIGEQADWHLIGHLQTNKVKYIAGKVKLIHSVDSLKLLNKLNSVFSEINSVANILIQVNTSHEESKFGIEKEDDLFKLFDSALQLQNVKISGLMTMAPFVSDEKIIRQSFRNTYNLFEKLKVRSTNIDFKNLSYGMSNDYEIAIEEGANLLRIGTAFYKKL
jgi:PLP dependent protein